MKKCLDNYLQYNILNFNNNSTPYNFIKNIYIDMFDFNTIKKISFPIQIGINLTEKCNLNCTHCSKVPGNVDLKDWKEIIDICDQNQVLNIYLTGGEPLLHPEIIEIIKYIKSKNISITILTNGLLLNDEMCDVLEKILDPNLDLIQISLDNIYEKYNIQRKNGEFSDIEKSIEIVLKHNINVLINTVVCESNQNDLQKICKFCYKKGIKNIRFSPLVINENTIEKQAVDDVVIKEFNKIINEYKNSKLKIYGDPITNVYSLLLKHKNILNKNLFVDKFICPEGIFSCEIDVFGDIYGCTYFKGLCKPITNIKDKNLKKRLTEYKNRSKSIELPKHCKTCEFINECSGGCPAQRIFKLKTNKKVNKICD